MNPRDWSRWAWGVAIVWTLSTLLTMDIPRSNAELFGLLLGLLLFCVVVAWALDAAGRWISRGLDTAGGWIKS